MQKVHVVACVDYETATILQNVCADSGVSMSSVVSALIEDFLDGDVSHAQKIVQMAKKIRRGCPRQE